MDKQGKFIVFEGLDGAGKTTVARRVFQWLDEEGIPVVFNDEPTTGPFGKTLWLILNNQPLLPELIAMMSGMVNSVAEKERTTEAMQHFWAGMTITVQNLKMAVKKEVSGDALKNFLTILQEESLSFADRFFDLRDTIIPALQKGVWVVEDRYELSSGAYGMARGMTLQQFLDLREGALGSLYRQPDLTFLIKTSPEVALARIEKEVGRKLDRDEKLENLQKVAKTYDQLIDFLNSGKRTYSIDFIDGNKSEDEVFERVNHYLELELSIPAAP